MGSGGSKANNGTTKASSLPKDLLNAIADEDYPMDPQSSSESSRKGSDASDTQLHSPIHETRQEHDITSLPAHQIDNQPQTVVSRVFLNNPRVVVVAAFSFSSLCPRPPTYSLCFISKEPPGWSVGIPRLKHNTSLSVFLCLSLSLLCFAAS